jgi:4-hydroxy-tetrahydrodipicolinate synthase
VASNVAPNSATDSSSRAFAGSLRKRAIERRLKPLVAALFLEGNPVPLKWAMSLLGHLSAERRLPLCEPAETTRAAVRKALKAAQDSAAGAISYMRLI